MDAVLGGQLHARRARVAADGPLRARLVRHHRASVRQDGVHRARVRSGLLQRLRERARARRARGIPRARGRRARAARPHPHRHPRRAARDPSRLRLAGRRSCALPRPARASLPPSTSGKTAIPSKPEAGTFQMGIEPWLGYGPWRIAEKKKLFEKQGMSVKITNFDTDDQINAALAAKQAGRRQHRDAHGAAPGGRRAADHDRAAARPVDDGGRDPRRAEDADDQVAEGQAGRLRGGHDQRHPAALRAGPERHEDRRHQGRAPRRPRTPASLRWPARSTRPSPTSRT